MSDEIIFEAWKQIAGIIGYSERQTYRYYEQVKDRLTLRWDLNPSVWAYTFKRLEQTT